MPVSTIHAILRKRIYTGQFEWNGKLYRGKREPLVSIDLWERVQRVLDGRHAKKHRRVKHDFALSGLIGCLVVGEIKKQRYVYYHCTGYADKCQGNPASCRRRYLREGGWSNNSLRCSAGSSSMTRCTQGRVTENRAHRPPLDVRAKGVVFGPPHRSYSLARRRVCVSADPRAEV